MSGRKRTVHQLDTPYSTDLWPEISSEDQDTILTLLCNLLAPLGQHRSAHQAPSKGKRAKAKAKTRTGAEKPKDAPSAADASPPAPEIADSVDVGFNVISRNLQSRHTDGTKGIARKAYSVVFVARGDQSSVFNCHFPRLVGSSGVDGGPSPPRLVGFSKSCSGKLSKALRIPRVSSVAIAHDAPGSRALFDAVNRLVKPIDGAQWLQDTSSGASYTPTKINAIQTTVGQKKQKVA